MEELKESVFERYRQPPEPIPDEEKARRVYEFAGNQGMERWRARIVFRSQIEVIWETGETPTI